MTPAKKTRRVALVTGAASGIGRATATLLAERDVDLALIDVDARGLEETAATCVAAGARAEATIADVSDDGAVESAVTAAVARFGRIDCAINAAGVLGPVGPLIAIDATAAERTFAINCNGVWLCMKHEARAMRAAHRGSIVNVASINGVRAASGAAIYSATKFAVIGMTEAAALELGADGVRVNALCPGAFPTPLLDASLGGRANVLRLSQAIPMRRLGRLSEVAEAAAWLCSDAASYVTGTTMIVDGGLLLR